MQISVRYLDNLRLEALFDDFSVIADQPIRYKGDGSAPGPFDYFLSSLTLCAAYFIKVYCKARDIDTTDIKVYQNNIVNPDNRYKQDFHIQVELPAGISDKDKKGIIASVERCTVKRVIQNQPDFKIEIVDALGSENNQITELVNSETKTFIKSKDKSLEETILNMSQLIADLGIKLEIASWRNQVPHVWSVHIRDADSPMCFTNGKGSTKEAALASALGEYIERISNNYFYNDFYLGDKIANDKFVHYPEEKWFSYEGDSFPAGLMDDYLFSVYNKDGELTPRHLIDTNSGNIERGICAIPFVRQSDQKEVFIPVNLIGNLFVSNGMSAGNTAFEARVQCLSEIFERAVKNEVIKEGISLPDVPRSVIENYPEVLEGIIKLEETGFPILVKDASLGGKFPVMCVTLMNPKNGGVFCSFGAHPSFEVALQRSLTELLQGRSFEGFNDTMSPTFNEFAVREHDNIVEHFIDSVGVISWKFFSAKNDYSFHEWDFSGTTQEEFTYLMDILKQLEKEVYIADYQHLGGEACRILVPGYSEVYELDDLVWDNNNRALEFREDILTIHSLNDEKIGTLLAKLEDLELDIYTPISELIGIAFDENTDWGQCNINELKAMCALAIQDFEAAKEFVELFNTFNENTTERKRYYQLISAILDIELSDQLEIKDYQNSFELIYGKNLVSTGMKSISGEIKFFGLSKTDINLSGLEKHIKLIESYEKLQMAKRHFKS